MSIHILRLALVVLVLAATPLHAARERVAPSGQIIIVVVDITGARVANATVRLTRGRNVRAGLAASDGTLRLQDVEPGEWALTVTREGFDQWSRRVTVSRGVIEVSVTLQVAGVSETIEVQSVAGVVQDAIRLNAPATGGTRLDIPVGDLPVSLSLITQPLIQERGARTGMEASEIAVGVVAGIGVGSIPGYAMRGFHGNQVSLMRDGIRQNTVSQSSRPIDTFLLDRVEILKGPASVMYGDYDRRGARTLPVLRVRYRDPQRTWLYLDPRHGLIAYRQERLSRLNRWLYHGLHNLDFPFMYYRRPLWDIVVIVLSLGGITLSVTTMVAAWRRLQRHARRWRAVAPTPDLQPLAVERQREA